MVSVAKVLHRQGEIRYPDVCTALKIPETDNSHHRSLIAAGTWPVRTTTPPSDQRNPNGHDTMMTPTLNPIEFEAPLVNPSPDRSVRGDHLDR